MAWVKFLKKLNFDPKSFIAKEMESLLTVVLKGVSTDSDAAKRSFETLCGLGRNELATLLVGCTRKILTNKSVVECSQDDLEILLTPEDQLWHRELYQQ